MVTSSTSLGELCSVPALLRRNARDFGSSPAYREKEFGIWQGWSWKEVEAEISAMAMGLTPVQVYRYVLLPVAYRIIIPPMTSEFLGIFKNSSLALTIGVLELTAMTRQIEEYSYAGFEAFTAATVLYILVTAIVMWVMRIVEGRVAIPGMISLGAK